MTGFDAGTLLYPFVVGVDDFCDIVVGHDAFRQVAAAADDA